MPDNSHVGILKPIRREDVLRTQQSSPHPQTRAADVKLSQLRPFANHPFRLYEGKRLDDLVSSIKQNGIIERIVARPCNNSEGSEGSKDKCYEILSGHNRHNAARIAELDVVPVDIREGISDEEAQIIVVESNFNQRSIKEMTPSELAKSLYMLNEAMKKTPGYRSDLVDAETCSQSDNGLRTMCIIGEKYGFSQAKVARYIRVAQLSPELLDCLDGKKINMGVAENLSYLRPSEQKNVYQLLESGIKVNVSQAQALKKESKEHELDEDRIRQIVAPAVPVTKSRTIRLREDLFTKYFSENQPQEEIEDTIARALELFRQQNPMG